MPIILHNRVPLLVITGTTIGDIQMVPNQKLLFTDRSIHTYDDIFPCVNKLMNFLAKYPPKSTTTYLIVTNNDMFLGKLSNEFYRRRIYGQPVIKNEIIDFGTSGQQTENYCLENGNTLPLDDFLNRIQNQYYYLLDAETAVSGFKSLSQLPSDKPRINNDFKDEINTMLEDKTFIKDNYVIGQPLYFEYNNNFAKVEKINGKFTITQFNNAKGRFPLK